MHFSATHRLPSPGHSYLGRMRYFVFIPLVVFLVFAGCYTSRNSPDSTTATVEEEWLPLFNGRDLDGWTIKFTGRPLGENYRNTFVWADSILRISYDGYETFDDAYAHMYYRTPYSHYKLRFDYRFVGEQVPGGASWNVRNSGVMLHSQSAESNEYGQHFPVSVELQLLGGLSDGKERPTGNVCTPGTAVVMGDTVNYNHCISSSSPTYHGDGWVSAEAVVYGGEAMHFLIEGDTVLSFTQPQIGGGFIYDTPTREDFRQAGMDTTIAAWIDRAGEVLTGGYLSLQAESHPIDFRKVELLVLPEN